MYREFIKENGPAVASVESGLRSISYLLPGRFKDSEVASEGIFACIRLLGYYHDSILEKEAVRQNPKAPSLYNRYTKTILKRYPLYRKLAILLVWIQSFEAFAEMVAAKRFGKEVQSKLVWMVESAKFVIRIAMLKLNGRRMISRLPRMVSTNLVPERDFDPSKLEAIPNSKKHWVANRSGKEYLPVECLIDEHRSHEKAIQFMLSKALIEPSTDALDLVSRLSGLRLMGEFLFIARPLLYLFAIQKYGIKSYKPWGISLFIEILSLVGSVNPASLAFESSLTVLDKQIVSDRTKLLPYLLRGPFFESFTKYLCYSR